MQLDETLTLVSTLARLPRGEGRGFTFIGRDRTERYYPYEAMEAEAQRRAAKLAELGLVKGQRVALVLPEPHEFVLTFLGAVFAGVVPVPIFPRASFKNADAYVDILAHIIATSGSRVVFCMEANQSVVERVREHDCGVEQILDVTHAFEADPVPPPGWSLPTVTHDDTCFLQFTSGSTNKPKGVVVTHRNLVANTQSFMNEHGLKRNDQDKAVSWLPLYHDMGLIGFVLATLLFDIPPTILPTELFARAPGLWLETISRIGGTITYAPNFAFDLVVKRVKDKDLAALDLSRLRVVGSGAEPIRPKTLRAFAERFAPAGFRANAFLPSYGMAESTLAITFHPCGTDMVTDLVDAAAMREGRATPAAPGANPDDPAVLELMSCGVPFPGHELRIVDEAGNPLPERQVGQVVTRGPSVTPGYFENEDATREALIDGWLQTGDLGYIAEGNLYICGRLKDLIIIRGANHYPQDIEWSVGELPGIRRGNVFAFSVDMDGQEALVVAAEANRADAAELKEQIKRRVSEEFGLVPGHIAIVPLGELPKTSSGKAQRRKTKQLFEAGQLPEHPAE
ncbi:MAG: fatty acyl-AMP ligase [Polyangiales bacterium]|nr:fatty acyl-AMP ligase [Myxococcales bacterium]MCB9656991.1 fatty acyl-AMP ligase [Sandaracinaceae bacterium]